MPRKADPNKPRKESTQLVACLVYRSEAGKLVKVYVTNLAAVTPGFTLAKSIQRGYGEDRVTFRQRADAEAAALAKSESKPESKPEPKHPK